MSQLPLPSHSAKPCVRWFWLQGPFTRTEIDRQLGWVKENGFGGVEIAWVYPLWLGGEPSPGPSWLGPEWSRLVAETKESAIARGLSCDFTMGTCWPFCDSQLPDEDCLAGFSAPLDHTVNRSWEVYDGKPPRVLNHLKSASVRKYSTRIVQALAPALKLGPSSLFSDSLEIHDDFVWSPELWDEFASRMGYRLEEFAGRLNDLPDVRYDYRLFIGEVLLREFFEPYSTICREAGAASRVQAHGGMTDLLLAYALADIPESETLLFEPFFSRVPASAAALADKPVVSCETFTCIYGYSHRSAPGSYFYDARLPDYWKKERIADLKLLADAVFAQGVNKIFWHGMPYQPPGTQTEFYTNTHVGPDSGFADDLPAFNRYLENISATMQKGKPYADLAVYLPIEDAWMAGPLPRKIHAPGTSGAWDLRFSKVPAETEGYAPLWISKGFLKNAFVENGKMIADELSFNALYIDCQWLDRAALDDILRLAEAGLPIVLKRRFRQPGYRLATGFDEKQSRLFSLPNVHPSLEEYGLPPLLSGKDLPPFWAKLTEHGMVIFLAHPAARDIQYPMTYGQGEQTTTVESDLTLRAFGHNQALQITFAPLDSVVLKIHPTGVVEVDVKQFVIPAGRASDQKPPGVS